MLNSMHVHEKITGYLIQSHGTNIWAIFRISKEIKSLLLKSQIKVTLKGMYLVFRC